MPSKFSKFCLKALYASSLKLGIVSVTVLKGDKVVNTSSNSRYKACFAASCDVLPGPPKNGNTPITLK